MVKIPASLCLLLVTPAPLAKTNCIPILRVSYCSFHHFALNYTSLSVPASMPTCNLSTMWSLSLNPTCWQGLTSDFWLLQSLLLLGPHGRGSMHHSASSCIYHIAFYTTPCSCLLLEPFSHHETGRLLVA